MNTLNGYSKSTLTDKYVLTAAGGHRYIYDSEFIIGTQTAATGSWTGVSIDSELYDGKQISYWLPFNGSGNATLNLTLAGGTTTGAVNCYYGGTSRLTTHYGAGNIIRLVYRKNVNIGGTTYTGWWADANYVDGNTYTSAWCGTSAGTAAKTASCSNFTLKTNSYLHILVRYSNTAASALTLNVNSQGAKPIYINGKASSSSNYTLPAGTYLVFYDGTNFYFRTDKVLPGTIETATQATKSEVARYIECSDTRSTTIDPTTLNAAKGVMFDFKQKSVTGLAAPYSGIMTFRPYSNSTDWSGGPAHQLAFDVNGLHHRTASSATWGSWSDIITTTYYSDKLSGYITSSTASLSSYWGKLWDVTRTSLQDDLDMTFYIHSSYNNERGFIHLRARRDSSTTDGVTTYSFSCWIKQITGNLTKSRFRLYYNASNGKLQLWCNVNARWGVYNCKVISSTFRTGKEQLPITGTLYTDSFTTAQTLPTDSYTELTNVREPDYVLVSQHNTNDTEYPLVWSNETNTNNKTSNQLYKSYSDLIYNPKNKRLTVKGSVKTNVLTISSTSQEKHLTFSRGGYNYISAPSGGIIGFMVNGKTDCNSANCELVIQDGNLNPGTTNVTALGTDALRWSNIYAHLANLSASTYSILKLTRSGSTNGALITFANSTGILGHIGMTGATTNAYLYRYTSDAGTSYVIWDSGNDGSGSGLDADKLDGYQGSDYWRNSAEKVWTPATNIRMAPSANGQEWSFDFRDKGSYTGAYWQVWDESKTTLLKVDADTGRVSAPYGFVGAIGDGTMTIKPERNNEVNFGGTHNSATIYFGYRAVDSKPIPTQFVFGSSSGTATLVAKSATLSSVVNAGRYYLKYVGTTGTYADLYVNVRGTACTTEGTAGTTGVTYLLLGNGTAVSTTAGSGAENALGILRIYGSSAGYTNIRCGTNNGTGYTMYLPGANGQFVYHTNDTTIGGEHIPVYIAATGAATACTIVDGSGDTDRKLLVTNGSNGIYSTATITGNYATGNLISTRTGEKPIRHTCTNGIGSVSLLVHSNRGLYDSGNSYWMIYSAKDTTNVYIPKWASKGSATQPVYFNSSGAPALCTAYSGLLTALSSSSSTNLSITIGGTTKTVTDMWATSLANKYSSRPTTIDPGVTGDGSMFQFKCTSSVTDTTTDPGDGHILHFNWDSTGKWDSQIYLSCGGNTMKTRGMNGSGWNSWYTVLNTNNYTSYLGYIGTTAVQSSSAAQALTGITTLDMNGDLTIGAANNVDRFINFLTGSTRSWRIGYLGTGSGDANYLVFQTTKTGTASDGWYNTLQLGCETLKATFGGNVYAAHFYESSDEQLKTNIQEIINSDKMPIIKEFDWKEDNSHSYGLIAQELEEQGYSELVSTKDDGHKTVNYSAALSLIVGKLQVKIKELEKEIENLKNKN